MAIALRNTALWVNALELLELFCSSIINLSVQIPILLIRPSCLSRLRERVMSCISFESATTARNFVAVLYLLSIECMQHINEICHRGIKTIDFRISLCSSLSHCCIPSFETIHFPPFVCLLGLLSCPPPQSGLRAAHNKHCGYLKIPVTSPTPRFQQWLIAYHV